MTESTKPGDDQVDVDQLADQAPAGDDQADTDDPAAGSDPGHGEPGHECPFDDRDTLADFLTQLIMGALLGGKVVELTQFQLGRRPYVVVELDNHDDEPDTMAVLLHSGGGIDNESSTRMALVAALRGLAAKGEPTPNTTADDLAPPPPYAIAMAQAIRTGRPLDFQGAHVPAEIQTILDMAPPAKPARRPKFPNAVRVAGGDKVAGQLTINRTPFGWKWWVTVQGPMPGFEVGDQQLVDVDLFDDGEQTTTGEATLTDVCEESSTWRGTGKLDGSPALISLLRKGGQGDLADLLEPGAPADQSGGPDRPQTLADVVGGVTGDQAVAAADELVQVFRASGIDLGDHSGSDDPTAGSPPPAPPVEQVPPPAAPDVAGPAVSTDLNEAAAASDLAQVAADERNPVRY